MERGAHEDLDSFELLDGSRYYYDPLETYKERFLHAAHVLLGDAEKWPEPPEIYRKICEAKDPAVALERLKPEDPERAFFPPCHWRAGHLVRTSCTPAGVFVFRGARMAS